jgi:hypothetical protein
MQYFTGELWSKIGSPCKTERDEAHIEFKMGSAAYWAAFKKIEDRFSKKFLTTYHKNYGFNDFKLIDISVSQRPDRHSNPLTVILRVRDGEQTFRITYKRVSHFEVKYQQNNGCQGFDDWGYDEFLPMDDQTLSHEILFASGATILVHFKNGNIFVEKE